MNVQELAELYETKTDEELLQLAMDSAQLMPEAHTVLRSELARRGIVHKTDDRGIEQTRTQGTLSNNGSYGVRRLVAEALRIYHDHFWLFVKLLAPAVVVSYIADAVRMHEVRGILRHLSGGLGATEELEISFIYQAQYFVGWMVLSWSFATVCSAVGQLAAGVVPSVSNSFAEVREQTGSFLRVSVLLFLLLCVAEGAGLLMSTGVFWILRQRSVHLSGFGISVVAFGSAGLAVLVWSRFALAIPAVILDRCKAGQAIFRSDEITEGKWLALAVLLGKSIIGGYLAAMCPFWLASWIPVSISLPSWFPWVLRVASIAAVTVVEPTMLVGFTLLYLRTSPVSSASSEAFAGRFA